MYAYTSFYALYIFLQIDGMFSYQRCLVYFPGVRICSPIQNMMLSNFVSFDVSSRYGDILHYVLETTEIRKK